MAAVDTDYHQRDLYEHIEAGDFPSWTLNMQIMPFDDAKTYRFNPFDLRFGRTAITRCRKSAG